VTHLSRRQAISLLGGAAVAGLAGHRTSAAAQPTKLIMTMEFTPQGFHMPFYYARQKGWFEQAGVDLEIKDGKGSAVTINLVGAGQSDLGFTPGSAAAIARPKGVPVKTIATILHRSAYGLIVRQGLNLRRPEDFKGKEIVFTNGAIEGQLTEAFLAKGGLKKGDYRLLGVDAGSKIASIVSGKSDAACAPVPFYTGLLKGKQEIDSLLYSDFGIHMVDIGIISSDDTIKEKGPALKRFVEVMSRAYTEVAAGKQEEGAAAMRAARPDGTIDAPALVNMFNAYIPLAESPDSRGKPIGYISKAGWVETLESLEALALVAKGTKPDGMYDLAFAPGASR
jgi:NitT/TauT family transport system substrate-binding protein